MKKSLEGNALKTHEFNAPIFLDIGKSLTILFKKHPLALFVKHQGAITIEAFSPLRKLVYIKNEVIENNLRLIESLLPELLFAFSIVSNQEESINSLIKKFAKAKFPYKSPLFSKIFLSHKVIDFLQIALFADVFNKIWDGQIIADRVYQYNNNFKIEYYHHYQIRALLIKLLDKIYLKESTIKKKKGETELRINFKFKRTNYKLPII